MGGIHENSAFEFFHFSFGIILLVFSIDTQLSVIENLVFQYIIIRNCVEC